MPLDAATDKRVVITSPNRTEWLTHFGVSKSGGSMSAFYEYCLPSIVPLATYQLYVGVIYYYGCDS